MRVARGEAFRFDRWLFIKLFLIRLVLTTSTNQSNDLDPYRLTNWPSDYCDTLVIRHAPLSSQQALSRTNQRRPVSEAPDEDDWLQLDIIDRRKMQVGLRMLVSPQRRVERCLVDPQQDSPESRGRESIFLLRGMGNGSDSSVSSFELTPGDDYPSLLLKCHRLNGYVIRRPRQAFDFMPGTKWCGRGNRARGKNDYGPQIEADKCCQAHDKCSPSIKPSESMLGYTHRGSATISHCKCDDEFTNCLLMADTTTARRVGYIFFNLLKVRCFEILKTPDGSREYVQIYYPTEFIPPPWEPDY